MTGSKGSPWWDAQATKDKDADRMEINDFITDHGKTVSVFTMEVSKDKADKAKEYWDNLYEDPGTYHFAGKQCTSAVAECLKEADIGDFNALKPTSLSEQLREEGWKEEILK